MTSYEQVAFRVSFDEYKILRKLAYERSSGNISNLIRMGLNNIAGDVLFELKTPRTRIYDVAQDEIQELKKRIAELEGKNGA